MSAERRGWRRVAAWLGAAALFGVAGPGLAADALSAALQAAVRANEEAAASQQRIDELVSETQTLLQEYRQAVEQAEGLKAYNDELERLVAKQKAEVESQKGQLARLEETRERLVPLMRRMVEVLEQFVELDLPFLLEERRRRIQSLKAALDEPDLPLPEKYRRVLEAWQVESDYGRTIEAYSEPLEQDGARRTVDVLRVGRVALLYLTFDRDESGYWDRAARAWRSLPAEYNHRIARALQVARKEAPPELLTVPVQAPEALP